MTTDLHIVRVASAQDIEAVRALFLEYAESLGFSLCFQGFDRELEDLPGKYALPEGCLWLAKAAVVPVGVIGLRPLEDGYCEMKRLYLRPEARGLGLGRRLIEATLEHARRVGYQAMRLDTLKSMSAARALYSEYGFIQIPAYYHNPLPEVVYYEHSLRQVQYGACTSPIST